jgi:hypothetical protein
MRLLSKMRGQAAMEFLMTYGWAILVVLIVIGALAYFGVLSPSNLLPEKCTFPVSLTCVDFNVAGSTTTGSVTLVLQNGAGRDMSISKMVVNSDALASGGAACNVPVPPTVLPSTLSNGNKASFVIGGAGCAWVDQGRDKNRYLINVEYNWLDNPTVKHNITGELLAKKS